MEFLFVTNDTISLEQPIRVHMEYGQDYCMGQHLSVVNSEITPEMVLSKEGGGRVCRRCLNDLEKLTISKKSL